MFNKKFACPNCGLNTYGIDTIKNPSIMSCSSCGFQFDVSKTMFAPLGDLAKEIIKGFTIPIDAKTLELEEKKKERKDK